MTPAQAQDAFAPASAAHRGGAARPYLSEMSPCSGACPTPLCVLSTSALTLAKQRIGPLPTKPRRRIALLIGGG
jgi:hypothetical protein